MQLSDCALDDLDPYPDDIYNSARYDTPAQTSTAPLTPESTEAVMDVKLCKCGCGTEISSSNNWEYKRGHKSGGKKKGNTPRMPRAIAEEVAEEVTEEVEVEHTLLELNESQLDRIWNGLPLHEKAYAIACGLTVDRN